MKNYTKLKKAFQDDPETLASLEHQEKMELLSELASKEVETVKIEGLEMIKGDKGDTGEKGDQGERGFTGPQGEKGLQGEQGNKGERGFSGTDGKDGKDGKDGSPDTPADIVAKINTLKDVLEIEVLKGYESSDDIIKKIKKQGLEMRDVKGLPLNLMELLHGGGITNIYNGSTLVTNSGTSLNFTGAGVTSVTNINGAVTVDIGSGGGSPGGSIYQVQINDGAGGFTADASLTLNPSTNEFKAGTGWLSVTDTNFSVGDTAASYFNFDTGNLFTFWGTPSERALQIDLSSFSVIMGDPDNLVGGWYTQVDPFTSSFIIGAGLGAGVYDPHVTFTPTGVTYTKDYTMSFTGTNGVKIGDNSGELIGLWGVTPVPQPDNGITPCNLLAGSGAPILVDDLFEGPAGSKYSLQQVVGALFACGILRA